MGPSEQKINKRFWIQLGAPLVKGQEGPKTGLKQTHATGTEFQPPLVIKPDDLT